MSPSPPSKRRRFNVTTSTLSKPFKSPLKTPLQPKSPNTTPSPSAAEIKSLHSDSPSTTLPANPPPSTSYPTRPTRQPLAHHTTTSITLQSLQKRHTSLLTSLTTSRAQLETTTSALALEAHPQRSLALPPLIAQWRGAAREAAEEVYASARDKVNKMGGMQGLREREGRKRERDAEWAREEREVEQERRERERGIEVERLREEAEVDGRPFEEDTWDGQDEGGALAGGAEERESDEGMLEEERKGGKGDGGLRGGEEDEGYTMGHMLKDLRVEFGVIGWDDEAGRWCD